ncbi:ATP-grasp fold amidoligase family protein [Staphylococcus simulans]|uniref:ATP-grasp fold amidoligase family protein n=1 Tax=Staphylococcus simulans TaxID=1286 RepID=UPI000D04697F|nr:ATP-grasp fold amidoligase family protein [Staphylococcus simulans]
MINTLKVAVRKALLRKETQALYKKMSKIKVSLMRVLSDEQFTKLNIRMNTGINLNLKNPQMFVEKVNWLKLNYRNDLQTEYTDKYLMRKHLINHGYSHLLPPLIGAYSEFNSINFDSLPNKVFLKTNHTSGVNQAIEKNKTNLTRAKRRFDAAMKDNYFKYSREWNYKNIKPKILVEEYLNLDDFVDYKFFVFEGKVEFFGIIKNINDSQGNQSLNSKINLYDTSLNRMSIDIKRNEFDDDGFEFSEYLPEMIKVSEDLASKFPFCRVDFFVSKDKLYFGEMTFHPNGGQLVLYPLENEMKFGGKIHLEKIPENELKTQLNH